jgi:hypothetical protein
VAAQLVASRAVLSSTELVSSFVRLVRLNTGIMEKPSRKTSKGVSRVTFPHSNEY